MLAARTEPTIATPNDWPSWRLEEFIPEAMPAWVFGTPDITPLVIGELTMPAPIPNMAYVTIRYVCSVVPLRPDSGAHSAMTTGIGRMVRPAWSAASPRTSCRYKVDRNRKPAIAAIAQTALRLAPANGTLRKNRKSTIGSARRGS